MEMIIVISSVIKAIGYDPITKRMKLRFANGKTYDFCGVPENVHKALFTANSIGTYYNNHIKDRYRC